MQHLEAIGALLAGIGALAGGIAQLIEALGKKQADDAESGMGDARTRAGVRFPPLYGACGTACSAAC